MDFSSPSGPMVESEYSRITEEFNAAFLSDLRARQACRRRRDASILQLAAIKQARWWDSVERRFGRLPRLNAPEWAAYVGLDNFKPRRYTMGRVWISVDTPDKQQWRQERARRDRAIQMVHDN